MENESFEDWDVAKELNEAFISIKVDKEERPDIDSIYMNACQSMGGSGGWPLTIIMTHEQKPFFSGTYFPKHTRYRHIGIMELLAAVTEKWKNNRAEIMESSDEITKFLSVDRNAKPQVSSGDLTDKAASMLKNSFDKKFGGFGDAPKFPSPHNLLFLLRYSEAANDAEALGMVEKTLLQMYKGGIFDHIGFGFSRYSTDEYWLAPHFEKMLYDNALLTMAYVSTYEITGSALFKTVAEKTMDYVLRELTDEDGGFYCAQDADSDGVEGKYYVFTPGEIIHVLGEVDGVSFNRHFGITEKGNFEGKSIPNLIHHSALPNESVERLLPAVYEYRRSRAKLHKDDKILTSWNSLMITAFATAYTVFKDDKYLKAAQAGCRFIESNLTDGNKLFASFRDGKKSNYGFLDDYAFYIFAYLKMYEATIESAYLERALQLYDKVIADFFDTEGCGFYMYGKDSEQLIFRPKETYDGAMPSGNSVMSYNLVKLAELTGRTDISELAERQAAFMEARSAHYPAAYCFFMMALLVKQNPGKRIVCVLKDRSELSALKQSFPLGAAVVVLYEETSEYPLINNKTTFYVCENNSCLPPTNRLQGEE